MKLVSTKQLLSIRLKNIKRISMEIGHAYSMTAVIQYILPDINNKDK